MTLPNLMEVCLESVAELVYVEVFKNMKVRSDLKILAFCFLKKKNIKDITMSCRMKNTQR